MRGAEFEEQVASVLSQAGFDLERKPALRGLQPDFIVRGPKNEVVVVEAKTWGPRGGNTARALEQVKHYRETTAADRVFIVMPELSKSYESKGLVALPDLVDAIRNYFEAPQRKPRRKPLSRSRSQDVIFAAMPFSREYDDTFFVAMSYAARSVGATCQRIDHTDFTGDITEEIRRLIGSSVAVIVDLSESNPNVLYEAGYAHALGKPSVLICSSPLDALPFDVRNWNTLAYVRGQTTKLQRPLANRLKSALES